MNWICMLCSNTINTRWNTTTVTLSRNISASAPIKIYVPYRVRTGWKPACTKHCFFASYGNTTAPMQLSYVGHWSKLTTLPKNSYWRFNRYVCSQEGKELVIRKASWHNTLIRELSYLPYVFKESKKGFALRVLYWLTKPLFIKRKYGWCMTKCIKAATALNICTGTAGNLMME